MSDQGTLTDEVRAFLREHIDSYEQLEILLALRAGKLVDIPADVVATELRLPLAAVSEALEHLKQRKLVENHHGAQHASFRYAPGGADLAARVDALAEAYDQHRLAVMREMSENAIARLRMGAARTFADAFLLGDRKKNDG